MMRQKGIISSLLLSFLLVCGGMAWAGEGTVSGEIVVGGAVHGENDELSRAAEYNSLPDKDSTVVLGLDLDANSGEGIVLNLEALYNDGDEQEYGGSLDLKRIIRFETDYNRFFHRLDHDLLENLNAHIMNTPLGSDTFVDINGNGVQDNVKTPLSAYNDETGGLWVDLNGDGIRQGGTEVIGAAQVYHTDLNTGRDYGITHSEANSRFTVALPQFEGITFSLGHRFEGRKGWEQARTQSKCSSCHVVGVDRRVDEETTEINPSIQANLGQLTLNYNFSLREFEEEAGTPTLVYNNIAPPHVKFTNRLSFTDDDGALPFDRTPDSVKQTHSLGAKYDLSADNTFFFNAVVSRTTNRSSDSGLDELTGNHGSELDLDQSTFSAKWHSRLSRAMSLNVKAQYQNLDGDDAYINVNELTNPATQSVMPGLTLLEGIAAGANDGPDTWDFIRGSGYNRDVYNLGADLSWRVTRDLKLHFAYELEDSDIENAEEHHVTDETTEHDFKVGGHYHAAHNLNFSFGYELLLVDDPYAHIRAALPPDGSFGSYHGPSGTNLATFGLTYAPNIYDRREITMSNVPDQEHTVKLGMNWSPMNNLMVNADLKYVDGENDDVDRYTWENESFNGNLNFTWTPTSGAMFALGYNYMKDEYDSLFTVAYYDG